MQPRILVSRLLELGLGVLGSALVPRRPLFAEARSLLQFCDAVRQFLVLVPGTRVRRLLS